jgi:hypothetical protein
LKKLRTLLVTFNNPITQQQITAFRGAIIEKAGRKNTLFHNHITSDTYLYRYPLIQYKTVYKLPAIYCVDAGVDEIHKLFENKTWTIDLKGEKMDLVVEDLNLKTITLNIWDKPLEYQIQRWQALNEENYRKYQTLNSLTEKIEMLQRILVGNILSFAKGIEWRIDKPIVLNITDLQTERLSRMKDIKVAVFNIQFTCNVSLPNYIGLGKGASTGFGVVKMKRKDDED